MDAAVMQLEAALNEATKCCDILIRDNTLEALTAAYRVKAFLLSLKQAEIDELDISKESTNAN